MGIVFQATSNHKSHAECITLNAQKQWQPFYFSKGAQPIPAAIKVSAEPNSFLEFNWTLQVIASLGKNSVQISENNLLSTSLCFKHKPSL